MVRLILCLLMIGTAVWAVEPDEVLSNPVLEERAREVSKDLRCLVCRNEYRQLKRGYCKRFTHFGP